MERFFEDLSIGERVETARMTVGESATVAFAREYDPQAFHLSETAAKATLFGRLIASGWQTASWTMRLLVESGFFGRAGALGVGIDELRWLRPVYPGDTLRATAEIVHLEPSALKPNGRVRARIQTFNQTDDVVLTMVSISVFVSRGRSVSGILDPTNG